MDKMQMIRALCGAINELTQTSENDYQMMMLQLKEDKKLKFRQYQRLPGNENQLRHIDITIEI